MVREQVLGKTDFQVFPREIAQQWRTNDLNAMTAASFLCPRRLLFHREANGSFYRRRCR